MTPNIFENKTCNNGTRERANGKIVLMTESSQEALTSMPNSSNNKHRDKVEAFNVNNRNKLLSSTEQGFTGKKRYNLESIQLVNQMPSKVSVGASTDFLTSNPSGAYTQLHS